MVDNLPHFDRSIDNAPSLNDLIGHDRDPFESQKIHFWFVEPCLLSRCQHETSFRNNQVHINIHDCSPLIGRFEFAALLNHEL